MQLLQALVEIVRSYSTQTNCIPLLFDLTDSTFVRFSAMGALIEITMKSDQHAIEVVKVYLEHADEGVKTIAQITLDELV